MLVWFCIRAKLRAHTLRHPCLFMNALLALRPCKAFVRSFQASLPCSLLPLHQPLRFYNLCKRTLITCLSCPSRCIDPLHFYNLLKSTSTASPRAKLASLVKGEVLAPEKIRATTGGIVTPPTLPKPHYLSRFS